MAKKVLVVASGEDKAWEYLQKLDQNVGLYTRSGVEPAERVKNGEYAVGIVFSHVIKSDRKDPLNNIKKEKAHVSYV